MSIYLKIYLYRVNYIYLVKDLVFPSTALLKIAPVKRNVVCVCETQLNPSGIGHTVLREKNPECRPSDRPRHSIILIRAGGAFLRVKLKFRFRILVLDFGTLI